MVVWYFEDEATPELDALLVVVRDADAIVPVIWHFEIVNVLLMAERRQRISATAATNYLHLLSTLPIATEDADGERVRRDVLPLARAHRLTVYDAAWLELAVRLSIPLATTDRALLTAARAVGAGVLPA